MTTADALDEQIKTICAPWMAQSLRVHSVDFEDDRARANAADADQRQANLNDRAIKDQRAAAARQAVLDLKQKRRALPTFDEIEKLLRADWEYSIVNFDLPDGSFGRVRDLQCKRSNQLFKCTIGVTALSHRGPEYERSTMLFVRDDDAVLSIYEEPIVIN